MSTNKENWTRATNESFEDVAIESVEDVENTRLLENQQTTQVTTTTTTNDNALSTSINIEFDNEGAAGAINNRNPARSNSGGHFVRQQFYTLLNEARTHFVHPSEIVNNIQEQQNEALNENSNTSRAQSPDWRRNLNHLLSMSILPNAYNFQFTTTNNNNSNSPTSTRAPSASSSNLMSEERSSLNERVNNIHRRSSVIDHHNNNAHATENATTSSSSSGSNSRTDEGNMFGGREQPHNADDDTQIASQLVIKILTNLLRYLPFLCVILLKFLHDHILDILDIVVQQLLIFEINKSLCAQVAKLAQKNYTILVRDFLFITAMIILRFHLTTGTLDPFGLLITPPQQYIPILTSTSTGDIVNDVLTTPNEIIPKSTLEITQTISLTMVLYYVIINDLILKWLTILIKIVITMLPNTLLQAKPRSRIFVAVEYSSQFYRACAPMKEWVLYLGSSYQGMEAIAGVLFTVLYLIAKLFEFTERGKSLKKAILNLIRNRDPDRKPTERELSAVDVCPICHDTFTSPVVIECGHIFCDDCVNTWLKREHTCPMCRAKVREDIDFHDGSTTFFYQIF